MSPKGAEFLKRLRETFRIEAEEHIRAISSGLLELEENPDSQKRRELIEAIFREVHSLKGAARSVDLRDIEAICQPLESVFAVLKRKQLDLSPALCDLFHHTVDDIVHLVSSTKTKQSSSEKSRTRSLIRQLENVSRGAEPQERPGETEAISGAIPAATGLLHGTRNEEDVSHLQEEAVSVPTETVRIPTTRLGSLLLQAEEMTLAKMAASHRAAELRKINEELLVWKADSVKWKNRQVTGLVPEWDEWVEWNDERMSLLQSRMDAITREVEKDRHVLDRMVDEHLEAMKKVLMLPVLSIVEAFPKFIRDLARNQGKEVDLVVRGTELEFDKRLLEELKDPLIHLVRNCIDHGIEKVRERVTVGKPGRGTIMVAFRAIDSRRAEILVSDDGAGINVDGVRSAAIKAGILSREAAEKLDFQNALSLIFQSGISTSPIITDISGRGLGLAIVSEKVEKLGGVVSLDTQARVGTTFRLILPLTLATFRGVLVRVDEHVFVLPTMSVEHVARIGRDQIRTVENRETLTLAGQILSTVRLSDAIEMPVRNNGYVKTTVEPAGTSDHVPVVILASGEKRVAFQVDEILAEQEVLVKGLGKQLNRVHNIAGATVLGTGGIAAVLNVADLIRSAARSKAVDRTAKIDDSTEKRGGKILVAEDSITSRTLLKNILETAGLQVTTAVDGMDAFTQLRSGEFDLVVSDVDMPRMSGFELTMKIRSDKELSELPVVLVTALESREDRERGIDAGANAYIVKSSFDQSNLLEVVKRLL